ncbi:MAG: J domain-containing protein, partial [Phycisphaerales bacterium]|nr:J domain-containing protein [Phycisphaerales bacterium]
SELLSRFHTACRRQTRRQAALATLELCDPVDGVMIKQQYRRLAMRYHPDRGGDGQHLCEINAALAVLEAGEE